MCQLLLVLQGLPLLQLLCLTPSPLVLMPCLTPMVWLQLLPLLARCPLPPLLPMLDRRSPCRRRRLRHRSRLMSLALMRRASWCLMRWMAAPLGRPRQWCSWRVWLCLRRMRMQLRRVRQVGCRVRFVWQCMPRHSCGLGRRVLRHCGCSRVRE